MTAHETVSSDNLDAILSALLGIVQGDYQPNLPVTNPDGVLDSIHTAINITAEQLGARQHELRASEERIRSITEAARDAIIMMDPRGRVTFWNPAAERMFGYPSDEAIGKPVHQLLCPSTSSMATYSAPSLAAPISSTRTTLSC